MEMPRGSYTKAFLSTSLTVASAGGAVGSAAMNVPLVAAGLQGMRGAVGIQIWSIEIEIDLTGYQAMLGTNGKAIAVCLSQVPVTAEMFINNRDILWKWKVVHQWGSTVAYNNDPLVIDKDFYPAIPFYGQQLHLGVYTPTALGASITVYCKVWYSMVSLSQAELVQQLQNQLT